MKNFCNYLYTDLARVAEIKKAKIYILAHNARGYDIHFVLRDMYERNFKGVDVITTGLKILKIDVGNIRFLDSLSFFMQHLSSLPSLFGYEDIVIKGYFPLKFNTKQNETYEGRLPSIDNYDIDRMKPDIA